MPSTRPAPRGWPAILVFSMNLIHDNGKHADARLLAVALPVQMEFSFARAAGVTVENLKRMRALRRTYPAPRPRLLGLPSIARAGG